MNVKFMTTFSNCMYVYHTIAKSDGIVRKYVGCVDEIISFRGKKI